EVMSDKKSRLPLVCLQASALDLSGWELTANSPLITHHSSLFLCLLQPGVLLDELLLAEAGEADEELGGVAHALAA
ncbi:MAG: hypothetical protein QOC61_1863, partial [Acidobacteriota bacterium]|nr:hypothetical protein [Acidobacteriota bacterium]